MSTGRKLPPAAFASANHGVVGDVVVPSGRQGMTPAPRAALQALISRAATALAKPAPWTRRRINGSAGRYSWG